MKVLIATTFVPGVKGGVDVMVGSLARELRKRAHDVDVLRLPFNSVPSRMLPQMLAIRLHPVADSGDRLICIRTPSYLLRHPSKNLWFIHHHRSAYDLWGTPYSDLKDNPRDRADRQLIIDADNVALREARGVYTNSRVISDRLSYFNHVASRVLYPPIDQPDRFHCNSYGESILYVSRLTGHKRQDLAIRAMQYVKTPVRLVVAGAPDHPSEVVRLRRLIAASGAGDRIQLREGWLPEEEKIDMLANALAVVYCPLDEDSYGYPSLEAAHSNKAVISTNDSGGVGELIVDGRNGYLTDPDPIAIAEHFDNLYEDRALAERMGDASRARIDELDISWDTVIEGLLS